MESEIKIAPCGLICSVCDAYRATQGQDEAMLEKVAAHWRELNHTDAIKAEHIRCDGCMSSAGCKSFFCTNLCTVRKCAIQHSVAICSDCPEYAGCSTLAGFFAHSPEGQLKAMKQLLDAVREVKKNMDSIL